MQGYDYHTSQIPTLLELKYIPEQPAPEAAVIRAFLRARHTEYDRFSFSVRLGDGVAANPDHEPGIQRSTEFSSKKRADVFAWKAGALTIFESKRRLSMDALGKLLMYRQLYLEEFPDAPEPQLAAIAQYADADVERVFITHGITIYLYADATN